MALGLGIGLSLLLLLLLAVCGGAYLLRRGRRARDVGARDDIAISVIKKDDSDSNINNNDNNKLAPQPRASVSESMRRVSSTYGDILNTGSQTISLPPPSTPSAYSEIFAPFAPKDVDVNNAALDDEDSADNDNDNSRDNVRQSAAVKKTTSKSRNKIDAKNFIDSNELTIGKVLGEGAYGVVHEGTWRNIAVAIKLIKVDALSHDAVRRQRTVDAFKQEMVNSQCGLCFYVFCVFVFSFFSFFVFSFFSFFRSFVFVFVLFRFFFCSLPNVDKK